MKKYIPLLILLLVALTAYGAVELTSNVGPKNDGFRGMVDEDQIIDTEGTAGNILVSEFVDPNYYYRSVAMSGDATIATNGVVTVADSALLGGKAIGTSGNTVPLLDAANTWSATQNMLTDTKIQFRGANQYIHSSGASTLDISGAQVINYRVGGLLAAKLEEESFTLGSGGEDVIYFFKVNGELTDGAFGWDQASDRWLFVDDMIVASNLSLYFRDAQLEIHSSVDGQLDIDADTELEITAPTVDINASSGIDLAGAKLAAAWDMNNQATTNVNLDSGDIAAGVYGAASIDGDDINSNIAGRSITLASASPDVLNADAELYVARHSIAFFDPTAADDLFFGEVATATTWTSIYCKTLVGTCNLDVQIAGADINGSDIVCTTSGVLDSSLGGDTAGSVGEEVKLAITSVGSSPTYLMVILNGEYSD